METCLPIEQVGSKCGGERGRDDEGKQEEEEAADNVVFTSGYDARDTCKGRSTGLQARF